MTFANANGRKPQIRAGRLHPGLPREASLQLALSAAGMALWHYDAAKERISPSPELNAMLGLAPDEEIDMEAVRRSFAPGEIDCMRHALHASIARGDSRFEHEFQYIWPNGEPRWLLLRAETGLDEEGVLATLSGVVMDVTARKRVEQEKDKARERVQMLVREMSHRIKNNLQMVSSLLTMQQAASDDPHVAESLARARERVATVALLHNSLYRTAEFECLDTQEYLGGLCRHIGEVMIGAQPITLEAEIESHRIGIDQAVPLGLLLNELVTNAVKHAFSEEGGRIFVRFAREGDEFVLSVRDTGRGLKASKAEGLGMRLVRAFTEQLEAHMCIESHAGTEAEVRIPAQEGPGH